MIAEVVMEVHPPRPTSAIISIGLVFVQLRMPKPTLIVIRNCTLPDRINRISDSVPLSG